MARHTFACMPVLVLTFLCIAFLLTGTASASMECSATDIHSCPRGKSMMQLSTGLHREVTNPYLLKDLKIYLQSGVPNTCDTNFTMFRSRSNDGSGNQHLNFDRAFRGDIDEYSMQFYIANRAVCDGGLFVPTNDPSEADLCFTNCRSGDPTHYMNDLVLEIGGKSKLREMFGCSELKMGPEIAYGAYGASNKSWERGDCTFAAPYMHSFSIRQELRSDLNHERPTLLVFIGGSWRGSRGILTSLKTYSADIFHAARIFETHDDEDGHWKTKHFYKEIHDTYIRGSFSLQPGGDSATRAGFFQSWVHGCIPVVGQYESDHYRYLENSLLQGRSLEDYVVVSNATTASGLIQSLQSIPASKVRQMRMNLLETAGLMQWGYQSHNDPLSQILFNHEKEYLTAASKPWSVISATQACEQNNENISHTYSANGHSVASCKSKCAFDVRCKAIDFYASTGWCLTYEQACASPLAVHDGSSSYKVST